MQGLGAEYRVKRSGWPGLNDIKVHIKNQWRRGVWQSGLVKPLRNARQMRGDVRSLPGQSGQGGSKVNRMLAGAAADLPHVANVGETFA